MENKRILLSFDNHHYQFHDNYPDSLKNTMEQEEFESCMQVINIAVAKSVNDITRYQRLRMLILGLIGACFVLVPVAIGMFVNPDSPETFIIPSAVFFLLYIVIAMFSFKRGLVVSYQAVTSIEPLLRDFNIKQASRGITWRLHKLNQFEDEAEELEDGPTLKLAYHTIEIEITEPSPDDNGKRPRSVHETLDVL